MKFLQGCGGCMGCMSGIGCYNNPSALAGTVRMSDSADGCGACMGCMRGTGCMNSFGLHGVGGMGRMVRSFDTLGATKPPMTTKETSSTEHVSSNSDWAKTRKSSGYKSASDAQQNPQEMMAQRGAAIKEKKKFLDDLSASTKTDKLISDLKSAKDKDKVSEVFEQYSTTVLKIPQNSKKTLQDLMRSTLSLDITGLKKLKDNSEELAFLRLYGALSLLGIGTDNEEGLAKLQGLFADNKIALEQFKAFISNEDAKARVSGEIIRKSLLGAIKFLRDIFIATLSTKDIPQDQKTKTALEAQTPESAKQTQSLSGTQIGLIAVAGVGILGAAWYFMSKKKD